MTYLGRLTSGRSEYQRSTVAWASCWVVPQSRDSPCAVFPYAMEKLSTCMHPAELVQLCAPMLEKSWPEKGGSMHACSLLQGPKAFIGADAEPSQCWSVMQI